VQEGVVSGRWRGNDFNVAKLYELEDKVLGIVGLGNIGKKVARRAKAFDMPIQYYDVNRMTTDQEDALGVRRSDRLRGRRVLVHQRNTNTRGHCWPRSSARTGGSRRWWDSGP